MSSTYVGAGAEASATTGSDPAIPYPTGLQAGDLLWLPVATTVSSTFSSFAVPGFTRRFVATSNGLSPTAAGFYKIATGAETGTVTVSSPGGTVFGRMFAYRGVDQTTPFDVADELAGWSTGTTAYDVPSQTTATNGVTLVTFAFSNNGTGTFTPHTGYTELWDSNAGGTVNAVQLTHRLGFPGPAATGIRNIVRSGAVRGGVAGIALRSAPIPSATGTGTVTTSSTATGKRTPQAAGTGTVTTSGTAAGARTPKATGATGTVTTSGTAVGKLNPVGSGAGTVTTSGTAVGGQIPQGAGMGTVTTSGTAVGYTMPTATGTPGTVTTTSGAAGLRPQAPATGEDTVTTSGTAVGRQPRNISVTVGAPTRNPLAVGAPTRHPMNVGPARSTP